MSRLAKILLGLGVALVLLGAAAFSATREELASGMSGDQEWRLVATWTPKEYCLRLHEENGEGGACGYAIPPTMNETTAWLVCRQGDPYTLVGGPVTDRAERVRIKVSTGCAAGTSG